MKEEWEGGRERGRERKKERMRENEKEGKKAWRKEGQERMNTARDPQEPGGRACVSEASS